MTEDRLFCGVDIGASAAKLVILDSQGSIVARQMRPSGIDYRQTARSCLEEALAQAGVDEPAIMRTVATGYGRRNVDFADSNVTEIHCHGVGCFHHFACAMTIVDIGGQDNKVIRIDDDGRRVNFMMNRKCAAGTGAFIEEIALRLGIDIGAMDDLAGQATEAVPLSSFCTVFAKTEILSHLRQGRPVSGIIRGAFLSVAQRVIEMDPLDGFVVLSGGVGAHNPVIADILAEKLGRPVHIPPDAQLTGALGAALTALRQAAPPGGPEGR